MIPVGWLAPSEECWDTNIIQLLTNKHGQELYPTGLQFRHHAGFPPPHQAEGTILIIPGRYYSDHTDKINEALSSYRWVLEIITSDEESLFDPLKVEHSNIRWWVQTPREGRDYGDARLFGVGFPPHFNDLPAKPPPVVSVPVFLAAQNTHQRRREAFMAMESVDVSVQVVPTEGFTQGLSRGEYVRAMYEAKVAPAPSGAVSVDSFRFWEAIDSHAVPIADTVSPVDGETTYWTRLFDNPPFPILTDYADLPGYIEDVLQDWPAKANLVAAWWMRTKRQYAHWLVEDLRGLGAL